MKGNFTYNKWQSLLLLFVFFAISNYANAAAYYARATGNWNANATWSTVSNSGAAASAYPGSGDTVIIDVNARVVTIPANINVSCTTITLSNGGGLTFATTSGNSNSLTCSNTFTCGTTTKGILTMVQGSKLTCSKLFLGTGTGGNASSIAGRTSSSTFEFTGNGTDVVPVITGENASTPDFNTVIFNPGVGNTITIPTGFCSKVTYISSGIVDFVDKWSAVFTTKTGTSLSMLDNTTLKIGGDAQIPSVINSFIFGNSSNVDYTGTTQSIIAGPGYKNLTLSGPGTKTIADNIDIELTLDIKTGVTLDLNGKNLTIRGSYSDEGTGCVKGSATSDIWYRGYSSSSMAFDQTTPGTTNLVKNLILGETAGNGGEVPTPGNPLDLTIQNALNISGTVNFNAGHLVSNGNVTFKSDASTTAFVGTITDPSTCGITGDITVERFIPATRAYRPLTSSVTGTSIFNNWQEGGSTASLTGSILGNVLTTSNPSTPLAVGQHISGVNIPANTTITSIANAASNEYEISTIQNVASRSMTATSGIGSSAVVARFTGVISGNTLTTSAFTLGSALTIGQRISGGIILPNTVIISGSGNTYTVGLEIPSETIYYNGAAAGFGTHITGVSCTDAQLGQNDNTTGLDYTRSGNSSLYTYNNSSNAFTAVTNTKTETLTAGNPYLILIRGDRTIDLALNASTATNTTLRSTGSIVTGPVDVSSNLNTTTTKFNFVGNPYQAPVDLSLIYQDPSRWVNLGTSYTVFDTKINARGAYVTYDFDTSSSTNPSSLADVTIEPNQSFFVTTTGGSPTLIFNETDKNTTSNDYVPMFRKAQSTTSLIKGSIVSSATDKALDGFILAFSDNYSADILAEDTRKPTGNEDETLASLNGSNSMAIDKRLYPSENEVIALSLTKERLSDYILRFDV